MDTGRQVARAAGVVLTINFFSRLLGFVRDAVIAGQFGASGATDAYMVAYTLPYSLQAVLGMAFATVMVPVVTGYLVEGRQEEGWRVASSILNGTTLLLTFLTVVGMILAPTLVALIAPGFEPELVALTTRLTRIMFPSIIFMGAGMLLTGVLNAGGYFALPAFAPALANIIVILTVVFLGNQYRVQGLAAGTLAGFVGFFMVQLPGLKALGYRYAAGIKWQHPAVRRATMAMLPVVLSVAVNQIYLAVNRFFASGLAQGSIASLDFANRLMNLPLGVFVAAVSTAVFPAFSRHAARQEKEQLANTLSRGMGMVLLVSIPAAVGMGVLREPLVRLVFERGAFDPQATARTAQALLYFSVGLAAVGVNTVLTRAFYALGDFWAPVTMGLLSVAVNVLLSRALMPLLGAAGLALANSLAAFNNSVLLALVLQTRIRSWSLAGAVWFGSKVALAAAVMGVAVFYGRLWVGRFIPTVSGPGLALYLAVLVMGGALTFALTAVLMKLDEVRLLTNAILDRKGKS